MSREGSLRLALGLGLVALSGCGSSEPPEPNVAIYPSKGLALTPLAYNDTSSKWETVSILNESYYTLTLRDVQLLGTGEPFLEYQVGGTNGEITLDPRASTAIQVRVAPATDVPRSLWLTSNQEATLRFQVGGSGKIDVSTGEVDPSGYTSIKLEIPITFSLNCDLDGDGFDADECNGGDCDDTLSAIHPDQPDVCDGADNNCNAGLNDEDCPT